MELQPAKALDSSYSSGSSDGQRSAKKKRIRTEKGKLDARTRKLMTKDILESKLRGYTGFFENNGVQIAYTFKRLKVNEDGTIIGRGKD